uniref:UBC core domain-containing protein n=1 Tax=Sparus aurata TaxID=8175 RepID=A0A671VGS5_SPAAU
DVTAKPDKRQSDSDRVVSDRSFWKILMEGPPDTPYEKGVFELYCQFGDEYPVKPPLVRFVTRVSCQNTKYLKYWRYLYLFIVETNTLILEAVYGLLIIPEPEDPLDRLHTHTCAPEEFLTSRETYEREAEKHTEETAGNSLDDLEKVLCL